MIGEPTPTGLDGVAGVDLLPFQERAK